VAIRRKRKTNDAKIILKTLKTNYLSKNTCFYKSNVFRCILHVLLFPRGEVFSRQKRKDDEINRKLMTLCLKLNTSALFGGIPGFHQIRPHVGVEAGNCLRVQRIYCPNFSKHARKTFVRQTFPLQLLCSFGIFCSCCYITFFSTTLPYTFNFSDGINILY